MKTNLEPIRMTFAKNVKDYRNALNYPQEKLAEEAGLSVQTIKDIEGCRRWVSDSTLSKLADALNVSEYQLLLPEKYLEDKMLKPAPYKNLTSLKENIKIIIDEQFENAIKSGKFS